MALVNIPRDIDDPHYRYKMPMLVIRLEGRGGNMKTSLVNLGVVGQALSRNPPLIMKFFGFALGAQTIANENYLVSGVHDLETLTMLLDQFILKYVLCKKCNNPETEFAVRKETLSLRCKACGYLSLCDPNQKFAEHVIKMHSRK